MKKRLLRVLTVVILWTIFLTIGFILAWEDISGILLIALPDIFLFGIFLSTLILIFAIVCVISIDN